MKSFPPLPPRWQARLLALPGVLTLLSVLAVVLGAPQNTHDPQPRVSAGTLSPALPELRATPHPGPGLTLHPDAPPEPLHVPLHRPSAAAPLPTRRAAPPAPDLSWWGRLQTDGG